MENKINSQIIKLTLNKQTITIKILLLLLLNTQAMILCIQITYRIVKCSNNHNKKLKILSIEEKMLMIHPH